MASVRNSGQSAAAAGTPLDTTNGALPDAPTLIVPAGGSITIENDATAPGSKCIQVTPAAATQGYWGYTGVAGATNAWAWRGFIKIPTLPNSFQGLISFRSGGGGTPIATLALDSANHFQAVADIATTSTIASGAITANTWYDVLIQCENPSLSTGVMVVTVRDVAGTLQPSLSVSHGGSLGAGTANFGTSTCGHVRPGKVTTAGNLASARFKYTTFQTGSSAALPTPGANTNPSVPAIAAQVQGTGSTTFTAVPTDPDGTITGHSWVVTKPDGTTLSSGISGAGTASITIANQPTAGAYPIDYTASDDAGGQTTVRTYLQVPQASGAPARADRVVSNTGLWTAGGVASSIPDALSGWANTIQVTGSPTGGTFTLTVDGSVTTGAIAYNADAAAVKAALDALSGLPTVTVSGTTTKTITWDEPASTTSAHVITLGANSLTGGTAPTVAIGNGKYIISGDNPAGDSLVVHVPPPAAGHKDISFFTDWVNAGATAQVAGVSGPVTCQVTQGLTPITAVANFTNPVAGWRQCVVTLTAAEDTAFDTDRTDIRIEITASQS